MTLSQEVLLRPRPCKQYDHRSFVLVLWIGTARYSQIFDGKHQFAWADQIIDRIYCHAPVHPFFA